jgi:hypothetical protein
MMLRRFTMLLGVLLFAGALLLGGAGCGSDGDSSLRLGQSDPENLPVVTGRVFAPNGEFAAIDWWRDWPGALQLVSTAYANLFRVEPVGIGTKVSLALVSERDAADGFIDDVVPLVPHLPGRGCDERGCETDAGGQYRIVHELAEAVDICRLMVSTGDDERLMRAFVTSTNTDIDPSSEAVVRVVLQRIRRSPLVQLCCFTTEGLREASRIAIDATFAANGDTIPEITLDALFRLQDHEPFQSALDEAIDRSNPNCVGP